MISSFGVEFRAFSGVQTGAGIEVGGGCISRRRGGGGEGRVGKSIVQGGGELLVQKGVLDFCGHHLGVGVVV